LAQKEHRRHCPAVIFLLSRYGSDEEGVPGTEQNRAIKGAVFNLLGQPNVRH
jgi:hypothetical protein